MRDFFISVMNKSLIFPSLTVLLQLISTGHLYYTYQNGSSQIPAAFIELIILGAANTVVLIIFYSRFYEKLFPAELLAYSSLYCLDHHYFYIDLYSPDVGEYRVKRMQLR